MDLLNVHVFKTFFLFRIILLVVIEAAFLYSGTTSAFSANSYEDQSDKGDLYGAALGGGYGGSSVSGWGSQSIRYRQFASGLMSISSLNCQMKFGISALEIVSRKALIFLLSWKNAKSRCKSKNCIQGTWKTFLLLKEGGTAVKQARYSNLLQLLLVKQNVWCPEKNFRFLTSITGYLPVRFPNPKNFQTLQSIWVAEFGSCLQKFTDFYFAFPSIQTSKLCKQIYQKSPSSISYRNAYLKSFPTQVSL